MTPKARFALVLGCGLLAGILASLRGSRCFSCVHAIPETERARDRRVGGGSDRARAAVFLGLFALTGLVARALLRSYIAPPRRLIEGARIQLSANPSHRVELARQRREPGARSHRQRLRRALRGPASAMSRRASTRRTRDLEEERNRLAALMSELTQSVLVCNVEGRILLYNQRAKQLLSGARRRQRRPGRDRACRPRAIRLRGHRPQSRGARAGERALPHRPGRRATRSRTSSPRSPSGTLIRAQMVPVLRAGARDLRLRAHCRGHQALGRDGGRARRLCCSRSRRAPAPRSRRSARRSRTCSPFPRWMRTRRSQFTHIISDEAGKLSAVARPEGGGVRNAVKGQARLEPMLGQRPHLRRPAQRREAASACTPTRKTSRTCCGSRWTATRSCRRSLISRPGCAKRSAFATCASACAAKGDSHTSTLSGQAAFCRWTQSSRSRMIRSPPAASRARSR